MPDYELSEEEIHPGHFLCTVRHAATGQIIDASRDRTAMTDRAKQLNDGTSWRKWAEQYEPDRLDTSREPRYDEGEC